MRRLPAVVSKLLVVIGVVALMAATQQAYAASCPVLDTGARLCDLLEPMRPLPSSDSETSALPEEELFLTPASAEDTLFGRRWYGKLADFAAVHAEPSTSSQLLRDAGDGFVYASILTRVVNDAGETWYQINYNEYVHEDDIKVSDISEFRGVSLAGQPSLSFAWIVQEVYPSHEPGGEPDKSLEKLQRYDFFQIQEAVYLEEEEWVWYRIMDDKWVRQTQFSIVDVTPRPEDVGENEFWVEVDLYEQTLAAYEGDRMVFATLISSGRNEWPTGEGLWQVDTRLREYKMSGSESLPDYYHLEDIPYIMYYDMRRGIALHGTYWHDRFGYKHSHGCVNLAMQDAEWTFTWSATGPNDLWVYVHTSDPFAPFVEAEE